MGCHSAKFINEKGTAKVRDAVLRYEVKHPVINDDKMIVWKNFERKSWPGMILVSPRGAPILIINGEGYRDVLDLFISIAFDFYYDKLNHTATFQLEPEEQKAIASKKLLKNGGGGPSLMKNAANLSPEEQLVNSSTLKYPGKLLCIEKQKGLNNNLLVISDTGNNRLVLINEETRECMGTIGCAKVGLVDGGFDEACFHHPQGMCHLYRDNQHFIYLCDTKNHAIREINLTKKEVLTVIGTGEKGFDREGNKDPEVQTLSSPWDIVAINRDTLLIAMAGVHQIWALNLKTNRCFNFSGSGKEGNLNHKYDLKLCEWAQPSGLSLGVISATKVELYVADSESSAIRAVNMKSLKSSRPLVGGDVNPKNLHSYGDIDGQQHAAKLQHPLGVHFL